MMAQMKEWAGRLTREVTRVLDNDTSVEVGKERILGVHPVEDVTWDREQTTNTEGCGDHVICLTGTEHLAAQCAPSNGLDNNAT